MAADKTRQRITAHCRATTGHSNSWRTPAGEFFYEQGRENSSGAITGSVFKLLPGGKCQKAGSFKIDENGAVGRFPCFPLDKITTR